MCPIYEYYCKKCSTTKEILTAISAEVDVKCDSCHKYMKRQMTAPNFVLKGKGFYKPSKEDSSD